MLKKMDPAISRDPLKPITKVRGMYVTGPYRPPHCLSHTLTIVKFENTKATIVKYTEISRSVYVDMVEILDANINIPTITTYTTQSKNVYMDHMIEVLGMSLNEPEIYSFTQSSSSSYMDNMVEILGMGVDQYSIEPYKRTNMNSQYTHAILNISSLSTISATIDIATE